MISFNSKKRATSTPEIMDDHDFKGKELDTLLTDLKRVNHILGGNRALQSGLSELLKDIRPTKPLRIIDVGCGDGESLRVCAKWLRDSGRDFQLLGLDANPNILEVARERSVAYTEITYAQTDVLSEEFYKHSGDIVIYSLFLHHFENEEIRRILRIGLENAKIGLVISDLERSYWAFMLFRIFGRLFVRTQTAYHDGLVSVCRGFKKNELLELATLPAGTPEITWKWAFRLCCWIKK